MKFKFLLWIVLCALSLAACKPETPPTPPVATSPSYPPPDLTPAPGGEAYPGPGQGELTVITWDNAVVLIKGGRVATVSQKPDLTVILTLKDGSMFQTRQPAIDEVLRVIEQCGEKCKDIGVTTE